MELLQSCIKPSIYKHGDLMKISAWVVFCLVWNCVVLCWWVGPLLAWRGGYFLTPRYLQPQTLNGRAFPSPEGKQGNTYRRSRRALSAQERKRWSEWRRRVGWLHLMPVLLRNFHEKSILIHEGFLTWHVIGWYLCCQPIWSQLWKSSSNHLVSKLIGLWENGVIFWISAF